MPVYQAMNPLTPVARLIPKMERPALEALTHNQLTVREIAVGHALVIEQEHVMMAVPVSAHPTPRMDCVSV